MASPKARILCTEDDPDTRDLISLVLQLEGFEVVCAESADEVLELAKTQPFDLLVVDNWMPGLSGTQLTKKLRQCNVKTPILFYSAAAYEKDKENALLAGAQGYLVKPAGRDELVTEVNRLLAES